MTLATVIGTARYWQAIGQSYSDMFRGSLTASGFVTAGAAWLGMGKGGAILLGVASIVFWQTMAIGVGWAVWKWRVIHKTIEREWENNPVTLRQLALLEQIAANTRPDYPEMSYAGATPQRAPTPFFCTTREGHWCSETRGWRDPRRAEVP